MFQKRKPLPLRTHVRQIFKVLPLISLVSLLGAAENTEVTREGIQEFEKAIKAWDGPAFERAGATLARAASTDGTAWLPRYWLAVARFHQVLYGEQTSDVTTSAEQKKTAREACQAALEDALKIRPEDPELHAMLATLYGMRIATERFGAIRLGPKTVQYRDKALENGGENPRVQYLAGMSYLQGPDILGGASAAVKALSKAAGLFEKEAQSPAQPGEPRWGRVNCLAFLGRAQRKSGDTEGAIRSFRTALALNPADRIAKSELQQLQP